MGIVVGYRACRYSILKPNGSGSTGGGASGGGGTLWNCDLIPVIHDLARSTSS